MKHLTLLLSIILLSYLNIFAANFKSGDEVKIESAEGGDYYVAGGEIILSTSISGDFVVSGGEITINDSIQGDLLAAGGLITVNGVITDDIRISGGEIVINSIVYGDVIAFGGRVRITDKGQVMGDVVCFAGEVSLYGDVKGNINAYGGTLRLMNKVDGNAIVKAGEFKFDGNVKGNMEIQAQNIELGSNAACSGNIRYWQSGGELDFSGISENAVYDEQLSFENKEFDYSVITSLLGVGIVIYWVIFILAVILVLIILEYFLSNQFDRAAYEVRNSFVKSFGYGMLYLLGIPVLIVISFVIIIGFPIGLFALSLYGMSILFATSVVGLCVSHYFMNKSTQNWTTFQIVAYATITVVILKIIFMIPILGTMLKTIAMAGVYGAFLMLAFERVKNKTKV